MVKGYDFKEIEVSSRERWRKIDLLEKLRKKNEKGSPYFLLDGPPYANNVPHIGHIRNTIYKDFYIRQAFMQGKNVLFQPGFDTHGLPIENMVEKKLEFKSKKDILTYGVDKFCEECKKSAVTYKDVWLRVYDKLGSWYSWKEPYITFHNEYLESVWWSFKKMWDKGLVYEGKKPVFWCPGCETALAGYEVSDKYADVEDPLIIVKFKVKNSENDYLLVYTTTPWTLPSNVAIVAKADEDYVKAKTKHGNLIIAKNLVKLFDELEIGHEVIEEFKGKKLEGLEYESIVDVPAQRELQKNSSALKVYMSIPILKERVSSKVASKKGTDSTDLFEEFVSVDEGTGLVHCAPGHGKTDNLVGKHYGLPEISPLDDQCKFTDEAGKYKGLFVKEADSAIIEEIKSSGGMLYNHKVRHSYPLCWRCSSPLIFRMSNQWFLKVDMIKDDMLEANSKVLWQPEFAGERFQSWVANAEDWNFSRQRFWGIPIPIWKADDEYKVIGSREELEKELGKKLPEDFDLHNLTGIKLKSSKGKDMSVVGDIFDVWFDSGSAPYAAFHYPFENKELFESHYPVDRINEAQDQIRGWFYSLMFCGVAAIGSVPYKTISMPAWVVDKDGEKLSKSKGNYIAAEQGIEELGADNVRFYYCWDVDPSSPAKFNPDTVKVETSRVHNILWNLHNFLITQAKSSPEKLVFTQDLSKLKLEAEDKWILSRLASVIDSSKKNFDEFKLHLAGRDIYDFVVNDLSRTYVQIVRERIEDDFTPLEIIFFCVLNIAKLIAPISPHISDEIYSNLKKNLNIDAKQLLESVHLEHIPGVDKDEEALFFKLKNPELENSFSEMLSVVGAVLSARDSAQIGIRWPVKTVFVETEDKLVLKSVKELKEVILRFVNAKELEFKSIEKDAEIKVHFKSLAKEFGPKTGDVASLITEKMDAVKKNLLSGKEKFKIGDYELRNDFFQVKFISPKGFSMGEFKKGFVYIKSELDKSIEPEGYAREVMRRVQMLRKNMGLLKKDKIKLFIDTDDVELKAYLEKFSEQIISKVGASSFKVGKTSEKYSSEIADEVKSKKFKVMASKN